jgi:hypothetical protein
MARGNVPDGITDLDVVRDLAGVECLARENPVSYIWGMKPSCIINPATSGCARNSTTLPPRVCAM